jgi:hypothetical protein
VHPIKPSTTNALDGHQSIKSLEDIPAAGSQHQKPVSTTMHTLKKCCGMHHPNNKNHLITGLCLTHPDLPF